MTDRKENRKHLYYLNELSDFKVDSDDPDVRGWTVKDIDNRTIGKVDNLLVSKEKLRVLYLDIEVDKSIIEANHDPYGKPSSEVHEFINKDGENHLILPIGMARLNLDEKYVYSNELNHQTFAETKRMEKGYDIDRDYEVVVLESYNRENERDLEHDRDRNVGTGSTDSDLTGSRTDAVRRETTLDEERRRMQEADSNRHSDLTEKDRDDRNTERLADNDSFYDRGEFDYERYRNRDRS